MVLTIDIDMTLENILNNYIMLRKLKVCRLLRTQQN